MSPITPAYAKIRSYIWTCITTENIDMCRNMVELFKKMYGDNPYYTELRMHISDARVRVDKMNSFIDAINNSDYKHLFNL
jgi:hypothetical protein